MYTSYYLYYIIFVFRISSRSQVVQDDPLGALKENEEQEEVVAVVPTPLEIDLNLNNNTMYTDQPVLFMGQRSSTFDNSLHFNKSIHRSETMPAVTLTSGLAGIGSSLKFSFR